MIAGTNLRSRYRREQDRKIHPIKTMKNMVFLGAAVVVMYALAAATALGVVAVVFGAQFKFD